VPIEARLGDQDTPRRSGDTASFTILREYDRLPDKDFQISKGVILRKGHEYAWTRYQLNVSTANRRKVSTTTTVEAGSFYSGHRRDFSTTLNLRAARGMSAALTGQFNRIELLEGKFSTKILRAVVNTQFSPWIALVNNFQYDSVSTVLGWQSRFRWILRPGSDIYVVYTHNWQEDPVRDRFSTLDRRVASKVLYTHRF